MDGKGITFCAALGLLLLHVKPVCEADKKQHKIKISTYLRPVFPKIIKRQCWVSQALLLTLCPLLCFPGLQVLYYNFRKYSALFKPINVSRDGGFGFLSFYMFQKQMNKKNKKNKKRCLHFLDRTQLPQHRPLSTNNAAAASDRWRSLAGPVTHLPVPYGSPWPQSIHKGHLHGHYIGFSPAPKFTHDTSLKETESHHLPVWKHLSTEEKLLTLEMCAFLRIEKSHFWAT